LSRRPFSRAVLASVAVAAALTLAGCDTDSIAPSGRAQAPLSDKMIAELSAKQMDQGSPILVRLFKEEAEAEVWKQDRNGDFALLKTYPICRWSGDLGPKVKEGDRQAPEGFYTITPGQMNPNSNYYLAFNMGYPNAYDRALGRTGSELMIHGDCSSRGCYAMTDEQIVEIYALARESFFGGQRAFQVQAYPFRMTAMNMAKHRNSPHLAFWKMLKNGYDHFEVSRQEPKVSVCEKRYVFDAAAPEGGKTLSFNAAGKCPVYEVPKEIADAVHAKQQKDNAEYAALVSRNVSTVASRVDGGMHPVFYAKLNPLMNGDQDSRGQPIIPSAGTPGALPRTANNLPAPTTIPLLPGQTDVAEAERPSPASLVRVANAPTPRAAPAAKPAATPAEKPTTIVGLLGNLFGTKQAQADPAEASETPAPQPKRTVASRVKSAIASVSDKAKALVKKDKPEESRVASNAPALRSRIDDTAKEPSKAAGTREASAEPAREMRTAFSSGSGDSGMLSGAQPVVPAGTFNSRWYGTR
jgi:murein L,D-transpeptidase YafK